MIKYCWHKTCYKTSHRTNTLPLFGATIVLYRQAKSSIKSRRFHYSFAICVVVIFNRSLVEKSLHFDALCTINVLMQMHQQTILLLYHNIKRFVLKIDDVREPSQTTPKAVVGVLNVDLMVNTMYITRYMVTDRLLCFLY